MAKKKGKTDEQEGKELEITSAIIKDDFCNYSFGILKGVGAGDSHSVKGNGIIDDDMRDAFRTFNAHLACIDDVFKHNKIEIENIDEMHNNELVALYQVNGFSIKGTKDNECIILTGTKYVSSSGGRIDLKTPKIPLDDLSSYKWKNELKTAADIARQEVELYKNGKCIKVEEEVYEYPKQLKITDVNFEQGELD